MNLDEILERIRFHMLHENYDAAEKWRDHLNDMIRWQRHRAAYVREQGKAFRQDVSA